MNNNAFSPSSNTKLYVAHSVNQKNEEKQIIKEEKAPVTTPQAQPYQYINRSYYYDSMGGGYKGL